MRTRRAEVASCSPGRFAALGPLAANFRDRRQTHLYLAFDLFFRAKIKTPLAIALLVRAAKFLRATKRPELQKANALAALVNLCSLP
jgi:hypothetical protein